MIVTLEKKPLLPKSAFNTGAGGVGGPQPRKDLLVPPGVVDVGGLGVLFVLGEREIGLRRSFLPY